VNGQLKFNICKILAVKFEVVFHHRLESNDRQVLRKLATKEVNSPSLGCGSYFIKNFTFIFKGGEEIKNVDIFYKK
jgi:hypothetical protein